MDQDAWVAKCKEKKQAHDREQLRKEAAEAGRKAYSEAANRTWVRGLLKKQT